MRQLKKTQVTVGKDPNDISYWVKLEYAIKTSPCILTHLAQNQQPFKKNKMTQNTNFISRLINLFIIVSFSSFSVYSQEIQKMNSDTTKVKYQNKSDKKNQMNDDEIPHPFFTHMGMPEAVGAYSLRLSALSTQMDGKTKADFGFHLETGLSKFVGLHIRNDRFLDNTHSEIMFQFAVIKSKDGMSGFSPIIEFEIPSKKGANRTNTLVGFSTALVRSRFTFNQVFHYNPREDMIDGSAALVYMVSKRIFFVVEILAEKMADEQAILNMLGGVKVIVNKYLTLGMGYQQPVTSNKDFRSQYVFQPSSEWK